MSIDYQALYSSLFNDVTDAIEVLEPLLKQLKDAQRKTEEMYMKECEDGSNVTFLRSKTK